MQNVENEILRSELRDAKQVAEEAQREQQSAFATGDNELARLQGMLTELENALAEASEERERKAQQCEQLKSEAALLEKRLGAESTAKERQGRTANKLTRVVEGVEKQVAIFMHQKEKAQQRIKDLEQELERLRKQGEVPKQPTVNQQLFDDVQTQRDQLLRELADWKEKAQHAGGRVLELQEGARVLEITKGELTEEIQRLRKLLHEATAGAHALEEKLRAVEKTTVPVLEQKAADLRSELEVAVDEATKLRQERDAIDAEADGSRSAKEELERHLREAKQASSALESQVGSLSADIEALKEQHQGATKELLEAREENRKLERDLLEAQGSLAAVEERLREVTNQREVETGFAKGSEARLRDLQIRAAEAEASAKLHQEGKAGLVARVTELEESVSSLRAELASARDSLAEAMTKLEAESCERKSAVFAKDQAVEAKHELMKELAILKERVAKTATQASESAKQAEVASEQARAMQRAEQTARSELDMATVRLGSALGELQGLRDTLQAREAQLTRVRNEQEAVNIGRDEATRSSYRIKRLEEDLASSRSDLVMAKASLKRAEEALSDETDAKKRAQAQHLLATKAVESCESQMAGLRARLRETQTERMLLDAQLVVSREQLAALQGNGRRAEEADKRSRKAADEARDATEVLRQTRHRLGDLGQKMGEIADIARSCILLATSVSTAMSTPSSNRLNLLRRKLAGVLHATDDMMARWRREEAGLDAEDSRMAPSPDGSMEHLHQALARAGGENADRISMISAEIRGSSPLNATSFPDIGSLSPIHNGGDPSSPLSREVVGGDVLSEPTFSRTQLDATHAQLRAALTEAAAVKRELANEKLDKFAVLAELQLAEMQIVELRDSRLPEMSSNPVFYPETAAEFHEALTGSPMEVRDRGGDDGDGSVHSACSHSSGGGQHAAIRRGFSFVSSVVSIGRSMLRRSHTGNVSHDLSPNTRSANNALPFSESELAARTFQQEREIAALEEHVRRLQTRHDSLVSDFKEERIRAVALQEQLGLAEERIRDSRLALEGAEERCKLHRAELLAHQREVRDARASVAGADAHTTALQRAVRDLEDQLADTAIEKRDLEAQLRHLSYELDVTHKECADLRRKASSGEEARNDHDPGQHSELISKYNAAVAKATSLEVRVWQLEQQLHDAGVAIREAETCDSPDSPIRVAAAAGPVANLVRTVGTPESTVAEEQDRVEDEWVMLNVGNVVAKRDMLQYALARAKARIAECEAQVDRLQAHREHILNAQNADNGLDTEAGDLHQELATLESKLSIAHEKALESARGAERERKRRLDAERELDAAVREIASLKRARSRLIWGEDERGQAAAELLGQGTQGRTRPLGTLPQENGLRAGGSGAQSASGDEQGGGPVLASNTEPIPSASSPPRSEQGEPSLASLHTSTFVAGARANSEENDAATAAGSVETESARTEGSNDNGGSPSSDAGRILDARRVVEEVVLTPRYSSESDHPVIEPSAAGSDEVTQNTRPVSPPLPDGATPRNGARAFVPATSRRVANAGATAAEDVEAHTTREGPQPAPQLGTSSAVPGLGTDSYILRDVTATQMPTVHALHLDQGDGGEELLQGGPLSRRDQLRVSLLGQFAGVDDRATDSVPVSPGMRTPPEEQSPSRPSDPERAPLSAAAAAARSRSPSPSGRPGHSILELRP